MILATLKKLFKPKKIPEVGEIWVFDRDGGNPFISDDTLKVQIKAIKEGWVQYELVGVDLVLEKPINSFTSVYVYI